VFEVGKEDVRKMEDERKRKGKEGYKKNSAKPSGK